MKVLAAPSLPSRSKRTTSEEAELPIKEDPLQQSRGKKRSSPPARFLSKEEDQTKGRVNERFLLF